MFTGRASKTVFFRTTVPAEKNNKKVTAKNQTKLGTSSSHQT
jgi:hypothetical protein